MFNSVLGRVLGVSALVCVAAIKVPVMDASVAKTVFTGELESVGAVLSWGGPGAIEPRRKSLMVVLFRLAKPVLHPRSFICRNLHLDVTDSSRWSRAEGDALADIVKAPMLAAGEQFLQDRSPL